MNIDGLDNPCYLDFARFRPRRPVTLITDPFMRDPHEVMEELREADPDGHANLLEHIMLPERNTEGSPE